MLRLAVATCACALTVVQAWAEPSPSQAPDELQQPSNAPELAQPAPDNSAPAAVPAEQPASKLQSLIESRLSDFTGRKAEQGALEAFYKNRNYQLLWSQDGAALPQTAIAVRYLQDVRNEGLDPRDYPTPDFSQPMDEEQAAENDLKLTTSLLTYARHASGGRVSFTRVSGDVLYPAHTVDPGEALNGIASAQNLEDTLRAFEPQHPEFWALQAELAKRLASPAAANATTAEPEHTSRKHHRAKAARAPNPNAVIDTIIANMERWRWLPRDLGAAHVVVNVPDYSLSVFKDDAMIWQTKIVVGKPGETATPLLSETMKYLTVNPTWNVPPSIIRNEYLPALERDPHALERIGLKVSRNHDGSLRVYQPPGDDNALGHIRFNFPNPFLVYQHDTPNKNLFARDERALSHGCMRVQYPDKYAEVLLSLSQPQDSMTAAKVKSLYGDDERTIKLKQPIPVHITYQTAFVDKNGHLTLRRDIYGLDAALLGVMRGRDRAIADVPIPRNYGGSSAKPVMAQAPTPRASKRAEAAGNWGYRSDWASRAYGSSTTGFAPDPFDRAVGHW